MGLRFEYVHWELMRTQTVLNVKRLSWGTLVVGYNSFLEVLARCWHKREVFHFHKLCCSLELRRPRMFASREVGTCVVDLAHRERQLAKKDLVDERTLCGKLAHTVRTREMFSGGECRAHPIRCHTCTINS